jgi:hypothetical protein
MTELSKFHELRSKTDKQLVQIIGNRLDLGIRHASQALSAQDAAASSQVSETLPRPALCAGLLESSADTWEVAEKCRHRAKTAYSQVSRLLLLVVEMTADERRGVESRLDHLKGLLDSLSAIGSTPAPTEDQIAALARSLWEARGRPQGLPEQDWFLAERASKTQKRSHAGCV